MRRPPRGGGSIALARERLFLAVPLPKALLPTVRRAQAQLADIQGVRLLAKDQLHVTVAFVGEAVVGLKLRGVHVEADRRYHPHLTIARLKKTGPIGRKLEGEPMLFPVRSLCLYRSDLTFGGAEHTELMTVDLAAAGSE